MEACFKAFDKDGDGAININEFADLLKALFRNEKGKPYPIDQSLCNELFMIFNQAGDGSMSKPEFAYCWNNWIKKIVRPVSALLVIDVQNDFISGSLAVVNCPAGEKGEEVVAPINKMIDTVPFNVLTYSLDWHPSDHLSFDDNVTLRKLHESSPIQDATKAKTSDTVVFAGPPVTEQVLWPRHCVQESWGAEFHKDLKVPPNSVIVKKGHNPNVDSYSAFFDNKKVSHTELEEHLRSYGVTDCYVTGIATDICVNATAMHSMEIGFRTVLVNDACRGIETEAIKRTRESIREGKGVVVESGEVKPMVQGRDRRVELGHYLALMCRKSIFYPPKNKNSKHNRQSASSGENNNKEQVNSANPTVKASA